MFGLAATAAVLLTTLSAPAGGHLTWTLTVPAHGTARITTTGATGRYLGARPLDHATQAGTPPHRHHHAPTTTVCARDDTGPQSCATGRGVLHPQPSSHWERATLALGATTATATATLLTGTRLRRRRRAAGVLERAGVEG